MPLADIRYVLAATTSDEAIELVLDCYRAFEAKADQVHQASQKALAFLNKENITLTTNISTKKFPVRQVASIKKNITVPAFHKFIPKAQAQLKAFVEETEVNISGDPICLYFGPVNERDDGPVEICIPIDGNAVSVGDILVREIPAHHGAIGVATPEQSSFPTILEIWDDVISWVNKNKFNMTGETVCCYEIWHEDNSISIVQPFESNEY